MPSQQATPGSVADDGAAHASAGRASLQLGRFVACVCIRRQGRNNARAGLFSAARQRFALSSIKLDLHTLIERYMHYQIHARRGVVCQRGIGMWGTASRARTRPAAFCSSRESRTVALPVTRLAGSPNHHRRTPGAAASRRSQACAADRGSGDGAGCPLIHSGPGHVNPLVAGDAATLRGFLPTWPGRGSRRNRREIRVAAAAAAAAATIADRGENKGGAAAGVQTPCQLPFCSAEGGVLSTAQLFESPRNPLPQSSPWFQRLGRPELAGRLCAVRFPLPCQCRGLAQAALFQTTTARASGITKGEKKNYLKKKSSVVATKDPNCKVRFDIVLVPRQK